MSYTPTTDFLSLLRQTSGGVRFERMPGLDFILAGLQRLGFVNVSIGQTAPTANQPSTAWFRPSVPSWVAEGTLFLWNAALGAYEPATPALWGAFLAPIFSGASFQSVAISAAVVTAGTSLLAIQRTAPAATALTLPSLSAQALSGNKLQIVDFSTSVANHAITLTTPDGATIMQEGSWELLSTAVQLAGITLTPSVNLNAWVITP